jgi:hypothetical protein
MAPSKTDLANEAALQESQQLLNLWLQIKNYLAKAFTDTPVEPQEERSFLEAKSAVSQYTRTVSQKLPPEVQIGGERMQDLMRQAISISHLRSLPKADKQVLISNWHAAFISLARAVGCLQFIVEGYQPQPKAAKARPGMRGGQVAKKKASANWGGRIKLVIILALIAGAVYYLMNR